MKPALVARLSRTIFLFSLITVLLSLLAIEGFNDDLDETILNLELTLEYDYFKEQIQGTQYQTWRTARLEAIFLPGNQAESLLPDYLQGLSVPYSEEVEIGEQTYLVVANAIQNPDGRLFVSQDISVMESQELLSQFGALLVMGIVVSAGLILSWLIARYLAKPLQTLTHEIRRIEPGKAMGRLTVNYRDWEFDEIATVFNRFLEALEVLVERENSFVKLASHELRTPLAVMTGALDVIEKRNNFSEADQLTLSRIRRAARDMQQDVDVLLTLARGTTDDSSTRERISLRQSVYDTIDDMESIQPDQTGRMHLTVEGADLVLTTDPALVRMLIRNLLQNALKHTKAKVTIEVTQKGLCIRDQGPGLPETIVTRLNNPLEQQRGVFQESSFGLLIVQLICERLGSQLVLHGSGKEGTEFLLIFDHL